ncbi:MAG TPA: SGNH/GDSL hydrolase family protein [Gemmataceae bacterium]|nr:SGNH/GDSL hydrolase family protein [Gemmataceae bacterium]
MKSIQWVAILAWLLLGLAPTARAEGFGLVDGDRVVFLGNTLIEREQRYGYWETMLARRFNSGHLIFRNLGWSGDTVFGDARAGFGSTAEGFQHLKEQVSSVHPTVIFIAYGENESFEGKTGLAHFGEGLNVLLDTLLPTKARMVLLSPLPQEDLGRPLPVPTEHNVNLRLYGDALREVAKKRGLFFVDLYAPVADHMREAAQGPLTDDGIHLTSYGYWRTAAVLEKALGLKLVNSSFEVDLGRRPMNFTLQTPETVLPSPPPPVDAPAGVSLSGYERVIRCKGLAAGNYLLKIDGEKIATGSAAEWAQGKTLDRRFELDQVERLRRKIVEKNRLYFHRWRPENETYLFGFRKQEQGQNSKEIPEFDPLVSKLEAEIDKLKNPAITKKAHKYEFVRQQEVER